MGLHASGEARYFPKKKKEKVKVMEGTTVCLLKIKWCSQRPVEKAHMASVTCKSSFPLMHIMGKEVHFFKQCQNPCAETHNRFAPVCMQRKSNFQACLPASASNIPAPLFLEWRTALQHRGKAKQGETGEAEEMEGGVWCGKKEVAEGRGGRRGCGQPRKTVGGSKRQSRG